MTAGEYDDYDDFCGGGEVCPRCSGDGTIICRCGGDLCVCENNGDAPCPLCDEEGVVSSELADKFLAVRRRAWEAFNKASKEADPSPPQQEGTKE